MYLVTIHAAKTNLSRLIERVLAEKRSSSLAATFPSRDWCRCPWR